MAMVQNPAFPTSILGDGFGFVLRVLAVTFGAVEVSSPCCADAADLAGDQLRTGAAPPAIR